MKQMLERRSSKLQEALHVFLGQTRFAHATELALSRRFLEAEGLLMINGVLPSDPEWLDLLARIAAQQHRYGRARHLWEVALQLSPNNRDYRAALRDIDLAELAQRRRKTCALIFLATFIVASLTLAIIAYWPSMFAKSEITKHVGQQESAPPEAPLYGPWQDPASYEKAPDSKPKGR